MRESKSPKQSAPTIHSFLDRGIGHDFAIHKIENQGQRIRVSGWCRGISEGDTLVLPNGSDRATYAVESIKYAQDPRDQFFAWLTYAPERSTMKTAIDSSNTTGR